MVRTYEQNKIKKTKRFIYLCYNQSSTLSHCFSHFIKQVELVPPAKNLIIFIVKRVLNSFFKKCNYFKNMITPVFPFVIYCRDKSTGLGL